LRRGDRSNPFDKRQAGFTIRATAGQFAESAPASSEAP
jgi:hypothetical protein